MEYCEAIKGDEGLIQAAMWINLKVLMARRQHLCIISL